MKISIDPRTRHTVRGLKRCSSCGEINGQRALLCRNEACELRLRTLANRRPFDPVALVVNTSGSSLYSLRSKERDAQPRNFVAITEVTLALEEPNSAIVSRNAICFVDTCKYDACDATDISCKHIRACTTVDANKSPLPRAEVYKVEREVLWNLNIDEEQKQRLWHLYIENKERAPAVQRLNGNTFAVKCVQSKVFPAGWLHVTAVTNEPSATSIKKTAQPHACACKKLKIIVEPDNSVVMQEEICDHLLLVLAAILSKPNGKNQYGTFTNALKSFWMPFALETPVADSSEDDGFFSGLSINIAGECNEQTPANDIFIFGNEYLADDLQNIPDLSDVVLDMQSNDLMSSTHPQCISDITNNLMYSGDPNLVSSCAKEDVDMKFSDLMVSPGLDTSALISSTHLELSDCNIELMDQFHQLTDQIDLCSDDIALSTESAQELVDTNNISVLSPTLATNTCNLPTQFSSTATTPVATVQTLLSSKTQQSCSLLKTAQLMPSTTEPALPPIELPTIAVVKKCPPKAADIVAEVKTRKFPHIPTKRSLIVNSPQNNSANAVAVAEKRIGVEENLTGEPSLAYSAWLDHIIEMLNESISIVEKTEVFHSFYVHEEIFAHFSKSFSVGIKWRMPNTTTVIKSGKHKGLIKYTWYFTSASTVQRIFSTKNIRLELERSFEESKDGTFVPYVQRPSCELNTDRKHRRIYAKLALYVAHIWFDCGNNNHKSGLKLEWLPNAFPKSHFGIMGIEFSLGIRDPHKALAADKQVQ